MPSPSMLSGIISTFQGWAIDLNLVPMTKYGPPWGPTFTPTPTPVPTPTPIPTPTVMPTPVPTITPDDARMLNQMWSSIVPSWLDKHASSFSLPSFDLFGSATHAANLVPAQSHASPLGSIGFPKFMDMNLFSPMGFISFIGFLIAMTLPLWAVCGLAFKGGLWHLKKKIKK